MAAEPASTVLSVRGEARQVVPPDYATVMAAVRVTRGSKAEAVRHAAEALDSLTAELAAHGGVALEAGNSRHELTWSAQSVSTFTERAHDSHKPTGFVTAAVEVVINVRAFDLLDSIGAVLAALESVRVYQVSWDVDWDNPAWTEVRAAAIQAAIRKGRDYAAALGVSLRTVEHIADAGLLGGGDNAQFRFTGGRALRAASHGGEDSGPPSLDPVPQELTAVIEARLVADGASLTGS